MCDTSFVSFQVDDEFSIDGFRTKCVERSKADTGIAKVHSCDLHVISLLITYPFRCPNFPSTSF